MPGSAWAEEEPTQGLDFSRHSSEDPRQKTKKEAVDTSCTRASKAAAQAEYTEAHKEVKKDKRDSIDSLAQEAEEAAYHGNMKDLYMTTKKLAGKYSRPERPVKDKQGQNITDSQQLLER